MNVFTKTKVLITVKTYPTPAKKGVEVSCTAGITEDGHWIRLYPIPFRFLGGDKQFHKYQWVELDVIKSQDFRPESYHPNLDSIQIVSKPIPTANGWSLRREIIEPMLSPSICHLYEKREQTGVTLGVFKPKTISGLIIEREESAQWTEEEQEKLSQASFFETQPYKRLEKIPYRFIYSFKCNNPGCTGHKLSIVDWEVGALYRRCRDTYNRNWESYFRDRMETDMILRFDTSFYVGTTAAHPHIWIIIGLFYPPK